MQHLFLAKEWNKAYISVFDFLPLFVLCLVVTLTLQPRLSDICSRRRLSDWCSVIAACPHVQNDWCLGHSRCIVAVFVVTLYLNFLLTIALHITKKKTHREKVKTDCKWLR